MAENLTLIDPEQITSAIGNWEKLASATIADCPKIKKEREKEILSARFGIGTNAKTLHSIGTKYGITRERIRQIVNNAVHKIQKNCENAETQKKVAQIERIIEDHGGFASQESVFITLNIKEKPEKNAVRFIVALSDNLQLVKESGINVLSWADKKVQPAQIKEVIKKASENLKKEKKVMSLSNLSVGLKFDKKFIESVLDASKSIMQTDEGEWGLSKWPHVNPKSIRDKSKYIMVRQKKPIHYSELTKKISDMGQKEVTKQSVHNELIKNTDFVLVGRGIYALTEWGYKPGVVEEVIVEILGEAGKPLHKDEIVRLVLERRIVKPSTIVLNLQKKRFKRVDKAVYTLS